MIINLAVVNMYSQNSDTKHKCCGNYKFSKINIIDIIKIDSFYLLCRIAQPNPPPC